MLHGGSLEWLQSVSKHKDKLKVKLSVFYWFKSILKLKLCKIIDLFSVVNSDFWLRSTACPLLLYRAPAGSASMELRLLPGPARLA